MKDTRGAGLTWAAKMAREYARSGGVVTPKGYSTANAHLGARTTLAELPERNVAAFLARLYEREARAARKLERASRESRA